MATPTIQFRDAIGAATITAQGLSLNNWLPDVDEINDRAVPMGTGLEEFWRYRRDFWASFEMPHIPAANLANLHRLKSHLLTGGFITVSTNDSASRVYTCSVKPGATPAWSFSDRTMCEYTLALEVRNVMPYPMICDYSSWGGTTAGLIENGGGETGTAGSQATSWGQTEGTLTTVDTSVALFGAKSLTQTMSAVNTTQRANQSDTGFTPGLRYLLSGWVRLSAGASGDGARIQAVDFGEGEFTVIARHRALSSGAEHAGIIATASGLTEWTYAAVLIDCTASGGIGCNLTGTATGAASAWYDGVRFEPVPKV